MREQLIGFRGSRSQQEMASKYCVTQQAWSKWERGIGVPRVSVMIQIERDSGIPLEVLFFNESNNQRLFKGKTNSPTSAA